MGLLAYMHVFLTFPCRVICTGRLVADLETWGFLLLPVVEGAGPLRLFVLGALPLFEIPDQSVWLEGYRWWMGEISSVQHSFSHACTEADHSTGTSSSFPSILSNTHVFSECNKTLPLDLAPEFRNGFIKKYYSHRFLSNYLRNLIRISMFCFSLCIRNIWK